MKRKTWGRAKKKQTPNSLFSLSNLNCREGRGWRDGGVEEEERKMRRNLRQLERDSHTFLPHTEV